MQKTMKHDQKVNFILTVYILDECNLQKTLTVLSHCKGYPCDNWRQFVALIFEFENILTQPCFVCDLVVIKCSICNWKLTSSVQYWL